MTSVALAEQPTLPDQDRAPWWVRLIFAVLFIPFISVLSVAAYLNPSDRGFGTHTQLGLSKCGLLSRTGYPCPSCGFTTSFSLMAEGRIFESFANQPMGAMLCIFTAMMALFAGYVVLTGSTVYRLLHEILSLKVLLPILAAFLVAWLYKTAMIRGWM